MTMGRFWHWFTQPSVSSAVRDLIAIALLGQGLIRAIDGMMFATAYLAFAPQWVYALAQIVCGGLLLLTRSEAIRHGLAGRRGGKCHLRSLCGFGGGGLSDCRHIGLRRIAVRMGALHRGRAVA